MSGLHTIIGVDPGPVAGIAVLDYLDDKLAGSHVIQASYAVVPALVEWLGNSGNDKRRVLLAVERFIVGRRASRSASPKAGEITRNLIGALTSFGLIFEIPVVLRAAVEIKPWASDARVNAAGLFEATKGMPHARDAARHALFAACKDRGIPDPLSKRGTPP